MLEFGGFGNFLQTVIIMKQTNSQSLKWELDRERFRIEDRFPPPERHPERRISDILTGLLRKDEDENVVLSEVITERWPVIAGEQLASHVRPSHLENGVLYLQADHSGWLAELRRLPKAGLLKKFASIPGVPKIRDIRFQLDPAIRTGRK
jgi:predicted nucleic acid-binding Zn ribbon protein